MNAFVAKVEEHTTNEVSNRGGFSSVFPPDPPLPVYSLDPSVRPSRERTHSGGLVEEVWTHRVLDPPECQLGQIGGLALNDPVNRHFPGRRT